MTREEAILTLTMSKLTAMSDRKHDEAVDMAIEALNGRPQGEWKHTMTYYPYCSECEWFPEEDEMTHGYYNYCPNCGADMRGDEE